MSELLHRATYALPDVTLAVEGRSLRIVDVNRAGETFGYTRHELTNLSLDALLDSPRAELLECVAAANRSVVLASARHKDGTAARVSVRTSTSAAAAVVPCVLVVVRELPEEALAPGQIEEVCSALRFALASLERLAPKELAASSAGAGDLSLAQYACLEVETDLGFDPIERINGRYGLTGPLRAELDQAWRVKLERDPGLWQEHARLTTQYREWFQANRRGSVDGAATAHPGPRPVASDFTVSAVDMDLMSAAPLPFKPPEVPHLSVEQYAALTVEMDMNPNAHGQVLELYGIDSEATWRACEAHWTELLQADPALRKRWMRLAAELRGKLAKGTPHR